MSEPVILLLVVSIPLMLCSILPFGGLKNRKVYLFLAGLFSLAEIALFLAISITSSLYRGFGTYSPSPWDSLMPVIVCSCFCIIWMSIGYRIRKLEVKEKCTVTSTQLKPFNLDTKDRTTTPGCSVFGLVILLLSWVIGGVVMLDAERMLIIVIIGVLLVSCISLILGIISICTNEEPKGLAITLITLSVACVCFCLIMLG